MRPRHRAIQPFKTAIPLGPRTIHDCRRVLRALRPADAHTTPLVHPPAATKQQNRFSHKTANPPVSLSVFIIGINPCARCHRNASLQGVGLQRLPATRTSRHHHTIAASRFPARRSRNNIGEAWHPQIALTPELGPLSIRSTDNAARPSAPIPGNPVVPWSCIQYASITVLQSTWISTVLSTVAKG